VVGWIVAIISTLVTGLTIYMYTSGVQRKRKKAQLIFTELGKFLAKVRSSPSMPEPEYWANYKLFEAMINDLRYARGDD
jgi:hypothetical protein